MFSRVHNKSSIRLFACDGQYICVDLFASAAATIGCRSRDRQGGRLTAYRSKENFVQNRRMLKVIKSRLEEQTGSLGVPAVDRRANCPQAPGSLFEDDGERGDGSGSGGGGGR